MKQRVANFIVVDREPLEKHNGLLKRLLCELQSSKQKSMYDQS